jgi:DNA segregation ATPase FtsK/SpoIIIE-like protein
LKEITLEMVCELDEVELGQRAQSLSLTTLKMDEVEDNKATVNKSFKEELNGLRETARKLSRAVNTKSEVRPVVCFVEYHSPTQGTKRITRKDTGEFYRDEPMSGMECQSHLFEPDVNIDPEVNLEDLAERVVDAGATGVVVSLLDHLKEHRDSAAEVPEQEDELYDDAVRLVFEFGKASTSLLQRRMRIGYGRASQLIDTMHQRGLVGPADGSKPREILKPV